MARLSIASLFQAILDRKPQKADARIPYGTDANQFGDLRLPPLTSKTGKGPFPVVINLHGGFWRAQYDLEHNGHLCAALTAKGYATWNLEYRRIGQDGGGWPGTVEDAYAGADHLARIAKEHRLDLARVVAIGHSAGGHLAMMLAARKKLIRGAAALGGVVDLGEAWKRRLGNGVVEQFLGGVPEQYPERLHAASPIELLPFGVPLICVHGAKDDVVPIEIAEGFVKRAQKLGDDAKLIRLAGAGHFEAIDPESKEWPAVEDAVATLFK